MDAKIPDVVGVPPRHVSPKTAAFISAYGGPSTCPCDQVECTASCELGEECPDDETGSNDG